MNGAQTDQDDHDDRGSDMGDGLCMECGGAEPGTVFEGFFAQEGAPDDTLELDGHPNSLQEHVVNLNSFDDDIEGGCD